MSTDKDSTMSSKHVIFAANLAAESESLIYRNHDISDEALSRYWIVSRCRLQHWTTHLKTFDTQLRTNPSGRKRIWLNLAPLAEEILNTEILTRVWAAILNGINQVDATDDCDCIGRGALMGHLDAKNRLIKMILLGQTQKSHIASDLDKVRRKSERWADLLIALVNQHSDVLGFGCSESRVETLSHDFRNEMKTDAGSIVVSTLALTAIKQAYQGLKFENGMSDPAEAAENSHFNTEILAAILDSISPNIYNGVGKPYSRFNKQLLESSAESASGLKMMLNELADLKKWRSASLFSGYPR